MRILYFLFLSVVVAMGQTTLTGPTTLVENSAKSPFYSPHCPDLITYGTTTKAVRDMFPEECGGIVLHIVAPNPGDKGETKIACELAASISLERKFIYEDGRGCVEYSIAPKLESAEPPKCLLYKDSSSLCAKWSDDPKWQNGKSVEMPYGVGGDPSYEIWQAIADHCHIEARNDVELGPLTDNWWTIKGMRIVCK